MAQIKQREIGTDVSVGRLELRKGFTWRSTIVGLLCMILLAKLIVYHNLYNLAGGSVTDNSPSNGVIAVILLILGIDALLYFFKRPLRLAAAELVVIYGMLWISAGGLIFYSTMIPRLTDVVRNGDFETYENLPSALWPHGVNWCNNGRFEQGLEGFTIVGNGKLDWSSVEWKEKRWLSPLLVNRDNANADTALSYTVQCKDPSGKRVIFSRQRLLLSLLVKTEDFTASSAYYIRVRPDSDPAMTLHISGEQTKPSFSLPGGLKRIGVSQFVVPSKVRDSLTFEFGIKGPGRLIVQDIQILDIQGIAVALEGQKVVSERDLSALADWDNSDHMVVKPANMISLSGLRYVLYDLVPWRQWRNVLFSWGSLILLLFVASLAITVIFRKQWAEHERLAFSLNVFPTEFFSEESRAGKTVRTLLHNRVMWLGFALTLPLVLLKGINFYYPAVPAPAIGDSIYGPMRVDMLFTNPVLYGYFKYTFITLSFSLLAIVLLMETDILFSVWVSFFLFHLMFLFGAAFDLYRYTGYPWPGQQFIGANLGYLLVAVIAARRHLWNVVKRVAAKGDADDSGEMISYRAAALLLLLCMIGLSFWAVKMQMGLLAGIAILGFVLVMDTAGSRMSAEVGHPAPGLPAIFGQPGPFIILSALGGFAVFGATGMLLAAIITTLGIGTAGRIQLHAMQLGKRLHVRPRDIGYGLAFGAVAGLLIGAYATLSTIYGIGADNLPNREAYDVGQHFSDYAQGQLEIEHRFDSGAGLMAGSNAPLDPIHNLNARGITIGFAMVCLLSALRSLFMWFPLHPVGYILAFSGFSSSMWLMCFIGWLVRLLMLRIGGANSIRRGLIPFSSGMFLACVVSILLFDVIGLYLNSIGVTNVYTGIP